MLHKAITTSFFTILLSTQCYSQSYCDSTAFNEAVKKMGAGETENSIVKFSEQIKTCPNFTNAYLYRGICYYKLVDTLKGEKDFNKAIEVSTNKTATIVGEANFFFRAEMYNKAFKLYQISIKKDSTNAKVYYRMGRCKWLERLAILQQNKVDDYATDPVLKSYLKDEILNYYGKAITLDSLENDKLYASRDAMDAMKDMSTNYQYYYFRAIFKSNFYDYEGSLSDYEKSIQIHPTINAYETSAYLARKVGQKEKACKYIQIWASMISSPFEEKQDIFQKRETAKKFCEELGIKP